MIFDGNNNPINTALSAEQLSALVKTGLSKQVSTKAVGGGKSPAFDTLNKELPKVVADFDGLVAEARKIVNAAKDFYSKKGGDRTEKAALKVEQVQAKVLSKWKFGSKPGSGHVDVTNFDEFAKMITSKARGGGIGGGFMSGSSFAGGGYGSYQGVVGGMLDATRRGLEGIFAGFTLNEIFDITGSLKQEFAYGREMREIAYQTQGITGATETLQDTWTELGKTVRETGLDRTVFQKAYVKNIQRGMKDIVQTNKVTKAGLNTSRQLGLNAEATADMFYDWHMNLAMSAGDVEVMAGAMKSVAQQTGVTGEKLMQSAKSAEKLMKNMRDSGQLNAQAAQAAMTMAAAAEKRGVGEQMGEIGDVLTGGFAGWKRASDQMKNVIANAVAATGGQVNVYEDIWSGKLMRDPKKLKATMEGINTTISRFAGFDVMKTDLEELSDAQKMQANTLLVNATGKGLGEWKQMMEAGQESTITFSDRMKKFQQEMEAGGQTTEERMNLESKINQAKIQESSLLLASYDKVMKGAAAAGKTTADAFGSASAKKILTENKENIAAMLAIDPKDVEKLRPEQLFEKTALAKLKGLEQFADLNKIKMKIDPQTIMKMTKSSDPAKVQEAIEMLEAENRRIATEAEASTDPVKKAQLDLLKVNEATRQISAKIMWGVLGMLGELGIISALLSAQLAGGFIKLGTAIKGMFSPAGMEKLGKGVGGGIKTIAEFMGGAEKGTTGKMAEFAKDLYSFGDSIRKEGIKNTMQATKDLGGFATVFPALARVGGAISEWAPVAGVAAAAATALAAGIYGVVSAFEAGHRAAQIFNTTQEKLSINQVWAAEGAGLLTGALNFLTFGLFRKSLGPTGAATKALAHLFAAIPPLGWAFQVILMPIKVLIGVLKGIWRFISGVFIGLFEGLAAVFEGFKPIVEAIGYVFTTLGEAFGILGGEGSGNISIIELLATSIGFLGKTIGFVFKTVGVVIGTLIRIVLTPLELAIKALMFVLKPVLDVIVALVNGIIAPFKWLYDVLIGHSIIPDLVHGVIRLFEMLATGVIASVISLSAMSGTIVSSLSGIVTTVRSMFQSLGSSILGGIGRVFPAFEKGFARAREQGQGFFSSLWRGLKGQYTQLTGGKGVTGVATEKLAMAKARGGAALATARERGGALLKTARERGGALATTARERGGALLKTAREQGGGLVDSARKRVGATLSSMKGKGLMGGLFGKDSKISTFVNSTLTRGKGLMGGLFGRGAASKMEGAAGAAKEAAAGGKAPSGKAMEGLAGSLKNAAGPLLKMAVAAGLVIAAIMILAKVMQMAGLSSKEITTVGFMMAAVIGGIVGILALVGKMPPNSDKIIQSGADMLSRISKVLLKVMGKLLIGAVVLGIATVAIVALAAAILWASDKILGAFGLDPKKAADIALNVAAIIACAGLIGLAVIGASAALVGLGFLASATWALIPMMVLGAGALLLLTPAILLLATGIVKMSSWLMGVMGVNSEMAATTAKAVASILVSAGLIALAVTGTAALLAGLGALGIMAAIFGPVIIGAMIAGAIVLLALTPAVITLASAIITICDGVMAVLGVDVGAAAKTAEAVASILSSAGSIAWSITKTAALLAGLGALGVLIGWFAGPLLIGLMFAGAAVLMLMAPPVIALASAIIGICDGVMAASQANPAEAAKTAESVASILKSAGDIAWSVTKTATLLAGLGALGVLAALFGPAIIGLMVVGAYVLMAMTVGVVALAKSIATMGTAIVGALPEAQAQAIAKTLNSLGTVIDTVSTVLKTATEKAVAFAGLDSWGVWLGVTDSPAAKLKKAAPVFEQAIVDLATFFRTGIIDPIVNNLGGTNFTQATDILKKLPTLLDEVKGMLDQTAQKLAEFTGNDMFSIWGSVAGNIQRGASKIKDALLFTGDFFRNNLISPLATFPGANELSDASALLRSTSDTLPGMLGSLGEMSSMDFTNLAPRMKSPAITATGGSPDMHYEMKKEQIGGEPELTKVSSDELSEIAEYTQNLSTLQEILSVLREMKDARSAAGETTGHGETTTPFQRNTHKPLSPPNFHRLPAGNFNMSPARQVSSAGQH